MNRQPTEWYKMFSNDVTDKKLISKIYKYLIQLNIKKKKINQKNGQRTFNRHFSKDIQMANRQEMMLNITNY